jgi:hypothetical protein
MDEKKVGPETEAIIAYQDKLTRKFPRQHEVEHLRTTRSWLHLRQMSPGLVSCSPGLAGGLELGKQSLSPMQHHVPSHL